MPFGYDHHGLEGNPGNAGLQNVRSLDENKVSAKRNSSRKDENSLESSLG